MQPLSSLSPFAMYSLAFIAASAVWLGIVFLLRRTTLRESLIVPLIAAGVMIRALLLPVSPIGSDDMFRYVWDGRVQSCGINPYAFAPVDSALTALHTTDLPARVNNPTIKTPYLPFTQWIFWLAHQFGGEQPWGIKLLLLLSECLTLVLLAQILKQLALPMQNILLYALCPLPIVQFGLDGHIDGLGIPLMLWAVLLWLRDRRTLALFVLGLSISIKPVGLVLLPIVFSLEKTWKWRILSISIPLLTVFTQFLPYFWSADPFEGIVTFGKNWSYNGALFESLYAIFGVNQTARMICGILLAIGLLTVALQKWTLTRSVYYSVLLLLLCSPVVHPWYVAWLAAFLPLAFAWSGALFFALVSLTSVTVVEYRATGFWGLSPWILMAEYIPVFVLFFVEFRKNWRISRDTG
jgi:alpha-1,6-mannosyltransferase